MWERLRNRQVGGEKFRRQHAIEGFIVDFACVDHKVIIELDGSIHDESDQKLYDEERQARLEEIGFRVLGFRNQQVFEMLDEVIDSITKALILT